ncbi:hypothetical protein E1A91_D02G178800v1 [Gossypium mustelinum]|uniref:Uncharacterized protein n=1 Tax=Gossypium mustelinum TaxID=34275 RepID=A0A5D2VXA5_GOSMU|nr:hypothetical protein E1A91_D02G178800v1 [Gossypium mustelinum]
MIYRLHELLYRLFLGTAFFGCRHSFLFIFVFTPLKRIAPQKRSSIIVIFVAKASTSRPVYYINLFAIATHSIEFD